LGFGLSINKHNIDNILIEFIKNIENNISSRPNNVINFVRNNAIPILKRFQNKFPIYDINNKLIFKWFKLTRKFVKEHSEILISKIG